MARTTSGRRHAQDFVAALETFKVVKVEFEALEHGAHGTVRDNDPAGKFMTEQVSTAIHSLNGTVLTLASRGISVAGAQGSTPTRLPRVG